MVSWPVGGERKEHLFDVEHFCPSGEEEGSLPLALPSPVPPRQSIAARRAPVDARAEAGEPGADATGRSGALAHAEWSDGSLNKGERGPSAGLPSRQRRGASRAQLPEQLLRGLAPVRTCQQPATGGGR